MKSKIFKDRSIQAAMAKVKEELGSDALILTTRKVPKSPRDPYGKVMFEVEAAPKGSIETGRRSDRKPAGGFSRESQSYDTLLDELAGIRDLISLVGLGSGTQDLVCSSPESVGLFASLLRTGMSEKRVSMILRSACSRMEKENGAPGGSIAILKKYVINECTRRIETRDPFADTGDSRFPHVAAFVGPTGVGKTTTIAKLAAELSLKRKKKVGLISIDNYRIGAFEQLKAYASIMGMMCIPAFTREDVATALDRMEAMDIVLMDTAGHSPSDSARMDEAAGVLNSRHSVSVHLVLSLTTGPVDMKKAAAAFAALNPETYVFTKIDETNYCGKIMDQVCDFKLPVSLLTNGQRVPEDLVIPDTRAVLGIMLGTEQSKGDRQWIRQAG